MSLLEADKATEIILGLTPDRNGRSPGPSSLLVTFALRCMSSSGPKEIVVAGPFHTDQPQGYSVEGAEQKYGTILRSTLIYRMSSSR